MAMVSYEKVNTVVTDFFVAVNRASGALVSGLVGGDFTIALYNPSGTDVSGSVTVTVAEYGSSGNYTATFTPNATGEWLLVITHATHFPWGKRATYLVYDHLLGASEDSSVARYFDVHDSAGALVSGLVGGDFTIALYNPSGTEVSGSVTVTIAELGSSGRYKASFTANAEGKWLLEIKHATYFAAGKRAICRYYEATITAPSRPTLSAVADDETGTSATATITANNASNHMYVWYRRTDRDAWSAFGSYRTGTGDLQITGLSARRYEFIAFERSYLTGEWSLPSDSVFATVTDGAACRVEEAFYALLTGTSAISDLVDTRIHPSVAPQYDPTKKHTNHIVYYKVDSVAQKHLDGTNAIGVTRMQVDIYSTTYDEAQEIGDVVRENVDGYTGTVNATTEGALELRHVRLEDTRDAYEFAARDTGWHRVSQDYRIWHDWTVPVV